MKDPPGMLLERNQRADRAAHLLSVACGLALLDAGWKIMQQPGSIYFERGEEQLHIFALMDELRSGSLTRDAWRAECEDLSVGQLPLAAPQPAQTSATS